MAKMSSIQRVQRALEDQGLDCQIRELPESTRTAQEAAEAVGCQLGQIVKSLVFSTITDRQPILVMTSGTNRVDEAKLEDNVGEEIHRICHRRSSSVRSSRRDHHLHRPGLAGLFRNLGCSRQSPGRFSAHARAAAVLYRGKGHSGQLRPQEQLAVFIHSSAA